MAFTQADVEALEQAIASGETTVKFNGREVSYRSVEELRQALAFVEQRLAQQSGRQRRRSVQLRVTKGV